MQETPQNVPMGLLNSSRLTIPCNRKIASLLQRLLYWRHLKKYSNNSYLNFYKGLSKTWKREGMADESATILRCSTPHPFFCLKIWLCFLWMQFNQRNKLIITKTLFKISILELCLLKCKISFTCLHSLCFLSFFLSDSAIVCLLDGSLQ